MRVVTGEPRESLVGQRDQLPYLDLDRGTASQQTDRLIGRALNLGASDIHIEPEAEGTRIRYRLDGVLHMAGTLSARSHTPLISRIKVLADLDIAERRRPQDGRLSYTLGGHEVDVRVSVLPLTDGEKVVLRLLDRARIRHSLGDLGLDARTLKLLGAALAAPHGMVLVTGPTGSGKSTTLYAALSEIDANRRNVTTVEDPVEFDIAGINQVRARDDIGFGFAEALRSFLRQDPDVIMVGEIRDRETAQVAVRAALTGHLLLSTLHTNDAPSAATRLRDMGVESFLTASSLRLVVAQRLLRLICPTCVQEVDASSAEYRAVEQAFPQWTGPHNIRYGSGCTSCAGTGFRGRIAVSETMLVSEAVSVLIAKGASTDAVRQQAVAEGMVSLQRAAADLLFCGRTTLAEVVRVTV